MMQREISKSRVLVGTLFCGEEQYEDCVRSLERQTYRSFEHFIIKNRPNKEAHDELYRKFMTSTEQFDYFLKLDADMVLAREDSLSSLIRIADTYAATDHLMLTVHDFFTDKPIWGINLFSNRVRWRPISDKLFVDETPWFKGNKIRIIDWPNPRVLHAHNPSLYQAFVFGVHRALKIVQIDRNVPLIGNAYAQWKILEAVAKHYQDTHDKRLLAVLSGSYMVFARRIPVSVCISKTDFTEYFHESLILEDAALWFWSQRFFRTFNVMRAIQMTRLFQGGLNYMKDKIGGKDGGKFR